MKAWIALLLLPLLAALAPAHPPTEPKKPAVIPPAEAVAGETCLLKLGIVAGTNPGAGCIRLREKGQTAWMPLPGLLPRMLGLSENDLALGWHVLPAERELALPRAELELEAYSGIRSPLVKMTLDLRGRETSQASIPIQFTPSPLIAGNTHVHLKMISKAEADRYLVEVSQAEHLNAVYLSYVERALVDRDYTSNLYTDEDLRKLSIPDSLVFGNGEEYRHNIGAGGEGYGHVLLLNLRERILPASLGPGITKQGDDGTPLRPGLEKARADAATIIWCHNKFGREDIPSWLAGLVDAQNIFDGGSYGGYEDTYYRYLNLGLRVPFSTGTDWFIYDFSRVYVSLPPNEPLTPASWLKAMREGRTFITNGAWLEFEVEGADPKGELNLARAGKVRVTAKASGRVNFGTLEIVKNGAVVASFNAVETPGSEHPTFRTGSTFAAEASLPEFAVDGPCWIAARITPPDDVVNELGGKPFAHTSPVYVKVGGKGVFLPETAAQVRAELNVDVEAVIKDGSFSDSGQKYALRQLYEEALAALAELEKQHTVP